MKKKIVFLSCGIVVLLLLVSLSSVIGFTALQSQNQKVDVGSPLFTVRIAQSTHRQTTGTLRSEYLGKGRVLPLFLTSQTTLQAQLDKALKIIENNPTLVKKLFEKIRNSPQIVSLLREHGLKVSQVEQYIAQVRENPKILKDQLKDIEVALPVDTLRSLGLNTSSAIGCFITILVLLPLAIYIGLLIATITLITCLNIGNCFETIITKILYSLTQELR